MQKRVYPLQPITPNVRRDRVRDIEVELEWLQEEAATFLYSEESILCNLLTVIQSRALKLALANAGILLY